MKELRVVFYGVDSWGRPVFREIREEDGKYRYGNRFFGDTDTLFNGVTPPEEIITHYEAGVEGLCYFGQEFDCEPDGYPPAELGMKLIFDIELTKKIITGETDVV